MRPKRRHIWKFSHCFINDDDGVHKKLGLRKVCVGVKRRFTFCLGEGGSSEMCLVLMSACYGKLPLTGICRMQLECVCIWCCPPCWRPFYTHWVTLLGPCCAFTWAVRIQDDREAAVHTQSCVFALEVAFTGGNCVFVILELTATLSSLCFCQLRVPASACLTVLGLVPCERWALADVCITMKSSSDMEFRNFNSGQDLEKSAHQFILTPVTD